MTANLNLTKSEIFTVYNKLRAKARKEGDLKQVERLNKALGILQSKNYYTGEKIAYLPVVDWCGCKDWEFRNAKRRAYTGPCKHMLAELMIEMILERREAHNVTGILKPVLINA